MNCELPYNSKSEDYDCETQLKKFTIHRIIGNLGTGT